MASFCDCCGKQLTFGDVAGTVKHMGEKLKLCQACSEDLEHVETELAHGNVEDFRRQANSFQARIRKDTENAPFYKWWQDYQIRADGKLHGAVRKREEAECRERQKEEMLLTTGDFFEGYRVQKYLGVVTGETILGTGFLSEFKASFSDLLGEESNAFMDKIKQAREASMKRLKKNAFNLGANAVLGINFNTLTLSQNMMGVLVTGTAVLLEPETKPDFLVKVNK